MSVFPHIRTGSCGQTPSGGQASRSLGALSSLISHYITLRIDWVLAKLMCLIKRIPGRYQAWMAGVGLHTRGAVEFEAPQKNQVNPSIPKRNGGAVCKPKLSRSQGRATDGLPSHECPRSVTFWNKGALDDDIRSQLAQTRLCLDTWSI
jgi:hypothetical protein